MMTHQQPQGSPQVPLAQNSVVHNKAWNGNAFECIACILGLMNHLWSSGLNFEGDGLRLMVRNSERAFDELCQGSCRKP